MKLATPILLSTIVANVPDVRVHNFEERLINTVVDDSRCTDEHSLYIAVPDQTGGIVEYLRDALNRGAPAILLDTLTRTAVAELAIPTLEVTHVSSALGALAAWINGFPAQALQLLGVTGTNGKTTTTHLIAAILQAADHETGTLGTLGASYCGINENLGYTTPPPLSLHGVLARMRDAQVTTVAMEVSSHALALGRCAGLRFKAAAFTNLTRDHLDFHGTEEAYIAAKRSLFSMCDTAIVNLDDAVGRAYFSETGGLGYSLATPGSLAAQFPAAQVLYAEDCELNSRQTQFRVGTQRFSLALPGRFNIANALAALGVARSFGIPDQLSAQALAAVRGVPGRMERFAGAGCTVFVDYAHTPDALERALEALRITRPTRLTVVFGCGGERDAGKRPAMGVIASSLADRCILTSDNPRREDPERIIAAIRQGMHRAPETIPDRNLAIARAIETAIAGEVILIAGKGAEKNQIVGLEHLPFDDRVHVQAALAAYGKAVR